MEKIISTCRVMLKDMHYFIVPEVCIVVLFVMLQFYGNNRDFEISIAYIFLALHIVITCADAVSGFLTKKTASVRMRVGSIAGLIMVPLAVFLHFAVGFVQ